MDSGATSSATYDEQDCVNVRECDVKVTAAGSEFAVTKMGTALIETRDEMGRAQKIAVSNCLISPKFPCKLLSLPNLTRKGLTVTMTTDKILHRHWQLLGQPRSASFRKCAAHFSILASFFIWHA